MKKVFPCFKNLIVLMLVLMATSLSAQTKMENPACTFTVDTLLWEPLVINANTTLPETHQSYFIHKEKDLAMGIQAFFDNGMKTLPKIAEDMIMLDPRTMTVLDTLYNPEHLFNKDLVYAQYVKYSYETGLAELYDSYFFLSQNRIFCIFYYYKPNTILVQEDFLGIATVLNTLQAKEIPAMHMKETALVDYFSQYADECKKGKGFNRGNRKDTFVSLNPDTKQLIIHVNCNTTNLEEIEQLTHTIEDPEQRLICAPEQPEVVRALQFGYKVIYRFFVPLNSIPIGAVSFTNADILRQ